VRERFSAEILQVERDCGNLILFLFVGDSNKWVVGKGCIVIFFQCVICFLH
jgi:hypothetical protein